VLSSCYGCTGCCVGLLCPRGVSFCSCPESQADVYNLDKIGKHCALVWTCEKKPIRINSSEGPKGYHYINTSYFIVGFRVELSNQVLIILAWKYAHREGLLCRISYTTLFFCVVIVRDLTSVTTKLYAYC